MELDAKDYRYWKRALAYIEAGVPQEARDNLDEAPCGYWRLVPARTKPSFPCSIYREKGQTAFVLQIGHRIRTLEPNDAEWQEFLGASFLSSMPIDRTQWSAALESGWWPDGQQARQMTDAERLGVGPSGDNAASIEESLADQINSLAEILEAVPEPETQGEADKLTTQIDRQRALVKLAEGEREKEYRPLKTAADEVSRRFAALIAPGETSITKAEVRRKRFLTKLQAKLDEEAAIERKRQQAIVDAENDRIRKENQRIIEEAAAKRQAEIDALPVGMFSTNEPEPEPELLAEVAAPVIEAPRAKAGGAFSRSTGLRKKKVGTIVDRAKFIAALDGQADFNEFLAAKAQKLATAGVALDGMKITEELV